MTAAHMGMVFAAEGLSGSEKLLLLAYTNRTDDHGYCWPGQKRLVDDCGTSPATVKRAKADLVKKGLISSVRRVHPVTGEPISNLTRVNLELLKRMARSATAYDDNVVEEITFPGGAPLPQKPKKSRRTGSDLLKAQDEPTPAGGRAQDEPDPGSEWARPPVKMSPTPAQNGPLSLSDPSGITHTSLSSSAPETSAVPDSETAGTGERDEKPGDGDALPPELVAEAGELLRSLPGKLGPQSVKRLTPLVVAAFAAGWDSRSLAEHLMARCDSKRVRNFASVYGLHLRDLPAPPSRPSAAEAAIAACSLCDDDGLVQGSDVARVRRCTHDASVPSPRPAGSAARQPEGDGVAEAMARAHSAVRSAQSTSA